MHAEQLDMVFQRRVTGRAIGWTVDRLTTRHQRVLLRFTGYTALADLIDPSEDADDVLHIVDDLLAAGCIEAVDGVDAPHRASTWGELALGLDPARPH